MVRCSIKKCFHLVHQDINNLLPKIDEVRSRANSSNVAVISISVSKLDESVLQSEM